MQTQTDHDLLVRIDERLKNVEKQIENHLSHHFRATIIAWSITATAIMSTIIALLI